MEVQPSRVQPRSKLRPLAALLAAVVMAVGLGACGGDSDSSAVGLGELTTNRFFRFEPDEFEVRFDRETSFTLVNNDSRKHNFTLSYVFVDLDNFVNVDVEPNSTANVTFTVKERPRDGFFTFYCRYHQSEGMSGRIRVV